MVPRNYVGNVVYAAVIAYAWELRQCGGENRVSHVSLYGWRVFKGFAGFFGVLVNRLIEQVVHFFGYVE
jgi:hypothetical protein